VGRRFNWRWPAHLRGGYRREYLLIGAGGGLVAVSTVLPWLFVAFAGGVNLWTLVSTLHLFAYLPISMVTLGTVLLVGAYFGAPVRALAWVSIISAGGGLIAGGGDFYELVRLVDRSGGFLDFGFGILVALAGLISLTMAFFQIRRRSPVAATDTRPWRVNAEAPHDQTPGWKTDPWGVAGARRYWDGRSWTSQTSYRSF